MASRPRAAIFPSVSPDISSRNIFAAIEDANVLDREIVRPGWRESARVAAQTAWASSAATISSLTVCRYFDEVPTPRSPRNGIQEVWSGPFGTHTQVLPRSPLAPESPGHRHTLPIWRLPNSRGLAARGTKRRTSAETGSPTAAKSHRLAASLSRFWSPSRRFRPRPVPPPPPPATSGSDPIHFGLSPDAADTPAASRARSYRIRI